ncbi:MAG: hypothetical protein GY832_42925 [Chloroflexi bacterium]|nr:hypothetical protein [Chloroflexota bacterium]
MGRFILMRLLGLIPVLLILSMITFFLMHEVPGGPWKEGQRPFSDEQLAALRARYGLDKPVWQQYLIWISGVLKLDFGMSFDHPDEAKRNELCRQAERILIKDVAMVPIYHSIFVAMVKPDITGPMLEPDENGNVTWHRFRFTRREARVYRKKSD